MLPSESFTLQEQIMEAFDLAEEIEQAQRKEKRLSEGYGRKRKNGNRGKEDAIYGVWADHRTAEGPQRDGVKDAMKWSKPARFVQSSEVLDADELDSFESAPGATPETVVRSESSKKYSQNWVEVSERTTTSQKTEEQDMVPELPTRKLEDFERFTDGFGSKMLSRMGFKGKMGKNETGIAKPIDVIIRDERTGVGPQDRFFAEQFDDLMGLKSSNEKDSGGRRPDERAFRDSWKKSVRGPKIVFRTAEEIAREEEREISRENQEIVDMRIDSTSESATVKGLDRIGEVLAQKRRDGSDEFLYNLDLLAAQYETSVRTQSKAVSRARQRESSTRARIERLRASNKSEQEQITRIEEVKYILDRTIAECTEGRSNVHSVLRILQLLREDYPDEYSIFNLSELVPSLLHPVFAKFIANWSPLEDPTGEVLDFVRILRDILPATVFGSFIYDCVVPVLRSALTNRWNPREFLASVTGSGTVPRSGNVDVGLHLIDSWRELLPSHQLHQFLRNVIFPKLKEGIEQWNPRTDLSLHLWVHPWLSDLGEELKSVYPAIRQKLVMEGRRWCAGDVVPLFSRFSRDALSGDDFFHSLLRPWSKIFDSDDWNRFLAQNVLPKLQQGFARAVVGTDVPERSHPVAMLLRWTDVFPMVTIIEIFASHFLPRWRRALRAMLDTRRGLPVHAHAAEILEWYLGWRRIFDDSGAALDVVQDHRVLGSLCDALNTINSVFFQKKPRGKDALDDMIE